MANPWELRLLALVICLMFLLNRVANDSDIIPKYPGMPNIAALSHQAPESAAPAPKKLTHTGEAFRTLANLSHGPGKDRQVNIMATRTWTDPPFYMAYTNPDIDHDVSRQLSQRRVVELGITRVWSKLLSECCMRDPKRRGLVVDVGGNFGWYSLLAASHGCRSIAWEPVPLFRTYFQTAIAMNGYEDLIELRNTIVGNTSGGQAHMQVPHAGIWGMAGVAGAGGRDNNLDTDSVAVDIETVDDVVSPDENVCVMKVDVEGFEPQVMQGAKRLLTSGNVENVIFEYTPTPVVRKNDADGAKDFAVFVKHLLEYGFNMYHFEYNIWNAADEDISKPGFWDQPLTGHMDYVTLDNIAHDFEDIEKMRNMEIPEETRWRPHPDSLRASFGWNTNLWGSYQNKSFERLGIKRGTTVCDGGTYHKAKNPAVYP